jgi:hypothetical protein
VHLRSATVADAIAIIDLHFAAVHQTAGSFYPPEVLDNWSSQPDDTRYEQIRRAVAKGEELFVIAEDACGVIGFGSIWEQITAPHLGERPCFSLRSRLNRR